MSWIEKNLLDFLKKYSFLVNLFFTILLAYALSFLIWNIALVITEKNANFPQIRINPHTSLSGFRRNREEVTPKDDYKIILNRNIFNVKVNEAPLQQQQDQVVESKAKLKLLGVFVTVPPESSMAIIKDENTQKTDIYFLHDKVQGAELFEIRRDSVILLRGGRREKLNLYEKLAAGGGGNTPSHPPIHTVVPDIVSPGPNPNNPPNLEVRRVGNRSFEINKEDFEKITSNLGPVLTQARVVPYFRNGKIIGYKVFNIRPSGVFAKIGLRNGDVIKRVNGEEISSPEKALQLFQFLKTEDTFEIEILRNGQDMTFTYRLR